MSKNKSGDSIGRALGLPSLSDVLAETETDNAIEVSPPKQSALTSQEVVAADHCDSMDDLYEKTLQMAKDIADLGFDLDPARAPRMFEVAAQYYKLALETKNSKSDQSLKLAKLIIDERKLSHDLGEQHSDKADVVMVEDRNALIRRLREETNKGK